GSKGSDIPDLGEHRLMTSLSTLRQRMTGWFSGSVNRRILAAALTVGGISVVVKVAATAKELVVAYQFGTGDALDAFLIAFLVPSLVINVVVGSLMPAFTPVYIEVRETQGALAARRLFGSAIVASALLVLVVTCGLLGVMRFGFRFLATGFSAEKLGLTRSLFFVLAPVVLLNAVATMWSSVLNAERRFASVAFAPICVPLMTLVVVVIAGRTWGVYAIAVGPVLGFL